MPKGISSDSQVHISVIFLVKILIGLSALIAGYYNIQMKFQSIDRSVGDMHEELVVLTSKMHDMEKQHLEELEHHNVELEEENKSLMQRLGLKRK